MNNFMDETVVAISTPIGFSGIGIVRMTGKDSFDIIDKVFLPKKNKFSDYHDKKIIYGHIVDPKDSKVIDEVLVSKMISPNTYTKEDLVEINCHGGMIPVKAILNLLIENGAILAGPGEFTKRAFINGRIDLAQAEAVIDIINSKTEKSLEISMKQLKGNISAKINRIRDIMLQMLAHIEASIDYPEYDIEEVSYNDILTKSNTVAELIEELIYNSKNGKLIREGVNTAIIGKPNVGKSSLLNILLGESRAIVTEIAGTTRDTIEEYINIEGIPFKIIDTAGIRETEDVIEKIGIEKAVQILEISDLALLIIDSSAEIDREDLALLELIKDKDAIIVLNKTDKNKLVKGDILQDRYKKVVVEISATEGKGLDQLRKEIMKVVASSSFESDFSEIVSNIRHIKLLEEALLSIRNAITTIESAMPLEIVSTDIRDSWNLLGEITGDTVQDDLINQIFSNFCIGK